MGRRYLLILSTGILISLVWIQNAFAGAWTVPKNKVWGEYYMKWDYAKEEFTNTGKKVKLTDGQDARTWEFIMEPKLEYGVTDWATGMVSMEYKQSHYKQYGRPSDWGPFSMKNNGVTNVKVGGRVRIFEKPFVLSVQGRTFIYPGYGNFHGDDPAFAHIPGIGKGDDAFELRSLIGKRFDVPVTSKFALPCYIGAETGYRWRTRHVANDIPYFIEGGFWPLKWLLVKSELDGYKDHGATGSIKESYGIWRIGGVWEVFGGDSVLKQGNKMFNIEFQYGMTVWGKNSTAFQEWIMKVDTQF